MALVSCFSFLAAFGGCGGPQSSLPSGSGITYWRTLSGAAGDAQDTLVARFNEQHPDSKVTSEFQGSYSDLATKLLTAAAARRGPQVTQLGTFEIRQFAKSGVLVDLKPLMNGPNGLDTSGWPPTLLAAGEIDGSVYWLPFNVAVPVLYFNQDAFAAAGLPGPPETWADFFEYARKLTRLDEKGAVQMNGLALWNITWPLLSMIWSEGGELTNRDYTDITLNDPVVIRMLIDLQSLVREGAATLPDKASGGHRAAFLSGRAAMILDSQDAFSEVFTQASGFTPALANYPAGAKGKVYAPGGGGLAILASATPEQRATAWAYVRHMLSPESIAYYARESGYVAFTEESRRAAGDLLQDPRYAAIHDALPYLRADYSVNMSPAVRNAFDEAFQKILVQNADVQATLDAADARAEAAVKEELAPQ
ncbi:MAG: ABC transporter substrate-binding protein [Candidatus Hydrogenedentes bacterium]|nr:ABC transporter substrate-binding protein [Candidatus Hydrogenedentota bacterium]